MKKETETDVFQGRIEAMVFRPYIVPERVLLRLFRWWSRPTAKKVEAAKKLEGLK